MLEMLELLLAFHAWYKRGHTFSLKNDSEKFEMQEAIRIMMRQIKKFAPRKDKNGWRLQKFHVLLHLPGLQEQSILFNVFARTLHGHVTSKNRGKCTCFDKANTSSLPMNFLQAHDNRRIYYILGTGWSAPSSILLSPLHVEVVPAPGSGYNIMDVVFASTVPGTVLNILLAWILLDIRCTWYDQYDQQARQTGLSRALGPMCGNCCVGGIMINFVLSFAAADSENCPLLQPTADSLYLSIV